MGPRPRPNRAARFASASAPVPIFPGGGTFPAVPTYLAEADEDMTWLSEGHPLLVSTDDLTVARELLAGFDDP